MKWVFKSIPTFNAKLIKQIGIKDGTELVTAIYDNDFSRTLSLERKGA